MSTATVAFRGDRHIRITVPRIHMGTALTVPAEGWSWSSLAPFNSQFTDNLQDGEGDNFFAKFSKRTMIYA
jgi:hypothetical protein